MYYILVHLGNLKKKTVVVRLMIIWSSDFFFANLVVLLKKKKSSWKKKIKQREEHTCMTQNNLSTVFNFVIVIIKMKYLSGPTNLIHICEQNLGQKLGASVQITQMFIILPQKQK